MLQLASVTLYTNIFHTVSHNPYQWLFFQLHGLRPYVISKCNLKSLNISV